MFVRVAVNLPPVRGTFDYHLPPSLRGHVSRGHLVTVPFGRRRVQGVVISCPKKPAVPETRPVEGLVDPDPVVTQAQLKLAYWVQSQTLAPLIECLTLMIPPGLSQQADTLYTLTDPNARGETPAQQQLIDVLLRRGSLRGRQIDRAFPRKNWRRTANKLDQLGLLSRISILDPPRTRARRVRTARLAIPPDTALQSNQEVGRPGSKAFQRREAILNALIEEGEPMEVNWLYAQCKATWADLRYLEQHGLVALSEAEIWRDPLAEVEFVLSTPPNLTTDQARVWEIIQDTFQKPPGEPSLPILLHGVTGSGKTEIYLRAVAEALNLGRRAIILVPEIALTPQTVRRFLARFPGQIGLIHSQLSEGERYDTWRRSREGGLQVIIGARSALFAPLKDVGLIVLDESHDESYKQRGRGPKYHAREAAMAYARILNAVCILGSATPDVVTTYRAETGELLRLSLPKRILGHREKINRQAIRLGVTSNYKTVDGDTQFIELPPVRLADMRIELRSGNRSLFSRALQKALARTLEAHQQAILFLNRRGTSTYIFCRDCGWVLRCPRCETTMTYHRSQEHLLCHHCGYSRGHPSKCPNCESRRVKHFGAGTQRVQDELENIFPGVRSLRWDWDATRTKGAHNVILSTFSAHQADVLIGTQMLAKGLDLPLVTLVGVVSADVGLNMPDYRAPERTFQVLTQVAGRAGRGLLGGQVILQTYQPDHYAIQAASKHDYQTFFQKELRHRKDLDYPPFRRLGRMVLRHVSASAAKSEAERLTRVLKARIKSTQVRADIIGPTACFYRKIRGFYRWQIIVRAADPVSFIPEEMPEGWTLDIDPVSLL